MGLLTRKHYRVFTICDNCKLKQETKLPLGVIISDALASEECICINCGCNTLRKDENAKNDLNQPKF